MCVCVYLKLLSNAINQEEIKREHGATASQSYDSIIETASRPYQYIRFGQVYVCVCVYVLFARVWIATYVRVEV